MPELLDGIEIVLVAVGLFAVGEALYAVLYEGRAEANKLSRVHMSPRTGGAPGRRGCGARPSGFRLAAFRPAARDSDLPSYAAEKKLAKATT